MWFHPSCHLAGASPLPLDVGYLFLVGSNLLLWTVVQQQAVILEFSQETTSTRSSTLPSWSLPCRSGRLGQLFNLMPNCSPTWSVQFTENHHRFGSGSSGVGSHILHFSEARRWWRCHWSKENEHVEAHPLVDGENLSSVYSVPVSVPDIEATTVNETGHHFATPQVESINICSTFVLLKWIATDRLLF